jgi:hypothetical protein
MVKDVAINKDVIPYPPIAIAVIIFNFVCTFSGDDIPFLWLAYYCSHNISPICDANRFW